VEQPTVVRALRPAVVFIALVLAVALVWRWTPLTHDAAERRAAELTLEQAGLRLEDYFRYRLAALEDLSRGWSQGAVATPEERRARASILHASFSGFQAVNWVDARGVIVDVVPYEANRDAVGRDVHATRAAGEALEAARQSGRVVVSAPLPLFQGGRGVVVYAPATRSSSVVEGFVNGVFRGEDAVRDALRAGFLADYDVRLSDGDEAIFETRALGHGVLAEVRLQVGAREWRLSAAPRLVAPASQRERWLLALAVALAALVAGFVRVAATRREALRRSEARGRAIVDALPDLVLEARADGRITAVHGAHRKILTREVESQLGAEIAAALRTSASHGFELPVDVGGEPRWVEVRVSSLSPGEGIALIRDVTERREAEGAHRRLESQLRQVQKMEAVGRLAGGIAHDFNNLMTAVLAHAELARAAAPSPEVLRDLEQIAYVARRAAQLTQRLLTFSRREAGLPRAVNLVEVVVSLQPLVRRLIRETIELSVRVDDDPAWIMADPGQLEQVVVNLVVNASEAMPVAGRLELEVTPRPGDPSKGEPAGACVELTVRDNGVGMTTATRERLFEPYFTTKDERGSGLGLPVVYGVVTRAGGRIHVESTVGQGTTFRVVFPAVAAPAHAPLIADGVEPGTGTVLLVEDDPFVRSAAVRALARAGYRVLEAAHGQEAVALLAERRGAVDAVVSDLVMPVMGGRELVAWMAVEHPRVPVVLVSGYSEDIGALAARVASVLAKPYSPADLTRAVASALRRRPIA
jgi:signal transduction histidine kinase